jgi:hypothetical protein
MSTMRRRFVFPGPAAVAVAAALLAVSCSKSSTTAKGTSSGQGGAGSHGASSSASGGGSGGETSGNPTSSSSASSGSPDGGGPDGGSPDGGGDVLPPLPAGVGSGTTYYVSPSGDDMNAGTSMAAPWKTLDKVTSTTFGPGDTVLFQGGATFSGCPSFSGDKVKSTAAAPFTVSSYGTGPFTLAANCTGSHAAGLSILGVNGFYLRGATLTGNGGGAEYGVFIANPNSTPTDWVRVEGCDVSGFYTTNAQDYGGEIFVVGTPGPLDHVQILNNTLHGAQGDTSPDDNGIMGYGNDENITNVVYQGNTVFDIGGKAGGLNGCEGNGILANGVKGGLVQYNVAYDIGRNTTTCGGPAAIWAYASDHVVFQFNEAYGAGPTGDVAGSGCDWNAYDLDGSVTSSVLQYNYSHDNFGTGYLAYIAGTWSGNVVRYNISENDARGDGGGIFLAGQAAMTSDLAVYGNTVYSTKGTLFGAGIAGGGTVSGHVSNNLFFSDHGGGDVVGVVSWNTATLTGLGFLGNAYFAADTFTIDDGKTSYASLGAWAAASGQEKSGGTLVGFQGDPKLASPGKGGTVGGYQPAKLGGYLLQASSPVLAVGVDLTSAFGLDVGTQDFFGAAIPSGKGTGFNMGADGSPH